MMNRLLSTRTVLFLLAALLALMALAPAAPLRAQEAPPPALDALTIRIWPEFDQPSALVFLIGQLAADTPLPAQVRVPMPPGAELYATAYADDLTGDLLVAPATQEGGSVTVTLPTRTFWVEFYDPALQIVGEQRSYDLSWSTPFDVAALTLEVQQPAGARDLVVQPAAGGTFGTGQYNLPVFVVSGGSLAAGDAVALRFTYTNPGGALSVDQLDLQPAAANPGVALAPPAAAAPARSGPSTPLIIGLLAVGLAAVGGGVYWYLTSAQPAPRRGAAARPARRAGSGRGPARAVRFCGQCGQPAQPDDRFCRHCGAALRG